MIYNLYLFGICKCLGDPKSLMLEMHFFLLFLRIPFTCELPFTDFYRCLRADSTLVSRDRVLWHLCQAAFHGCVAAVVCFVSASVPLRC